jgi:glutathione-regulated potassium-efflux system ancillary protein KefG
MRKILILFAHPKYEHSDANRALISAVKDLNHVQIRDLYELYPDFNVNIQEEQELLFEFDVIVWQHPLYWYSCPPLLKQWIDLVLEYGWAYGPGGNYLKGKYIFNAVTSGGSPEIYSPKGKNRYTLEDYLRPFEQTALLCGMEYLPYFQLGGTHKMSENNLVLKADEYRRRIIQLRDADSISSLSIPSNL